MDDDVELILYGIGVMVLSCLLMFRGIWAPLIGNDDVDAYAIWLTAMISMYGIGYPIGHTAVIGWFSKAMKNKPQGFLLGIFGSAGSLARIVFLPRTVNGTGHTGPSEFCATSI